MIFQVIGKPHPDRASRVEELRRLGFAWADLEEERYWVDQVVVMNRAVYEELMDAAAALWQIFDKTARFVHGRRDLYALLSVPEVLWDGLDLLEPGPPGRISRYARFDFSVSAEGGIRMLELNADTPTGYVEASVATPWICGQYGIRTPNIRMAELVRDAWEAEQPEYAACVAYGEHLEDSGTIDMLVRHSGRAMRCVDCLDLRVDEGVLRDGEDRPISSLFALYPKEWMGVDEGGPALAYAIESGRLNIWNPLHAILLQSKGLQAVIWGLHELGSAFYSRQEHEYIGKYMLPTYNSPVFEGNYVSKAMFGREGGSVRMYDAQGKLDVADQDGFDTSTLFSEVYQERAELPRIALHSGQFHLLTGIFVINGIPCGLLGRAGGLITGNASHFIAMGVSEA
jgi:glutathionylspermidine synthase